MDFPDNSVAIICDIEDISEGIMGDSKGLEVLCCVSSSFVVLVG